MLKVNIQPRQYQNLNRKLIYDTQLISDKSALVSPPFRYIAALNDGDGDAGKSFIAACDEGRGSGG